MSISYTGSTSMMGHQAFPARASGASAALVLARVGRPQHAKPSIMSISCAGSCQDRATTPRQAEHHERQLRWFLPGSGDHTTPSRASAALVLARIGRPHPSIMSISCAGSCQGWATTAHNPSIMSISCTGSCQDRATTPPQAEHHEHQLCWFLPGSGDHTTPTRAS